MTARKADVLVISHVVEPAMSVLEASGLRAGWNLRLVRPVLGEPLPRTEEVAAIVVLGGPMSAWDTLEYPALAAETAYLAEAHRRGLPVLGICLGSHLLAVAMGGTARAGADGLECGLIDVVAEPAADDDVPLGGTHFSFHSDTATLPGGARPLAFSERYLQAWRLGSALGVQFHPELDAAGIDGLLAKETEKLSRFGVDVAALRAEVAPGSGRDGSAPGRRLLDAWFEGIPPRG